MNQSNKSDIPAWLKKLKKQDIKAKTLTTFSIGGSLLNFLEVNSSEELRAALSWLIESGEKYRILGAGSNLLIPDQELTEWVIKLGKGFRYCNDKEEGVFEVGGAMPLMSLSRELSKDGYTGLEFAGGIPGSLGGAVRMNAGAHGNDMSEIISEVNYLTPEAELKCVKVDKLNFSYRYASLPDNAIVLSAMLKLERVAPKETAQRRAEFLDYRKQTQPLSLPSAGSVFRNPSPERTAGHLIESVGLKGTKCGGASISNLHANWIVNEAKQASFNDVTALIERCQEEVEKTHKITLQPEIVRW